MIEVSVFTNSQLKSLNRPCVYAFVAKGQVLYIGSSANGIQRFAALTHHRCTLRNECDEIRVFWFRKKHWAQWMEKSLIVALRPPFNDPRTKSVQPLSASDRVDLDRYVDALKTA
jgi:hypothetical protein